MKGKKGKKMKKLKRIFSALLALAMVFSLSVPAFAEGEEKAKIIVPEDDNHTYRVYQILTGRYDVTSGSMLKLSDVKWGMNANIDVNKIGTPVETGDIKDLTNLAEGDNYTNAQKLYGIKDNKGILSFVNLDSTPYGYVDSNKALPIDDGYYLIEDMGYVGIDGEDKTDEAFSHYIATSGGGSWNITISSKKKIPTVNKKVLEINDSANSETEQWRDTADYDIGDNVKFKLTAKLHEYVTTYKEYKLEFCDTLSKGFDLDQETIKVVLKAKAKEATTDESSTDKDITDYFKKTVLPNVDGTTSLSLFCENVLAESVGATDNSIIEVTYTAKLNDKANVGATGNNNTVYLKYSNNPYTDGTGKTVTDEVKVYTFKLTVFKTTRDVNMPLEGARFTLYKKDSNEELIDMGSPEPVIDETAPKDKRKANMFNWEGLDAGDYVLKETKAPAGYNSIQPIEFTITTTYSDDLSLKDLVVDGLPQLNIDLSKNIQSKIINNPGSSLPETGGIGTTIFHVGGAILVVGAAILLVVRKKVSEEK